MLSNAITSNKRNKNLLSFTAACNDISHPNIPLGNLLISGRFPKEITPRYLISMFLRLLSSVFGIVTFNIPSLNDAVALSPSTFSGKDKVR